MTQVLTSFATDQTIERLTQMVQQALSETAFANRMMIAPRRLREIGAVEVRLFQDFMANPDAETARRHGLDLAASGLGHSSILRLTAALRAVCWMDAVSEPTRWYRCAEDYSQALVLGYMQAREDEIRLEQERTRAAYMRTLQ
ncbi:MAG: hypothetical protein JNL42_05445 [Anaerolineae bacterium]|nr:hypothetical protein [Anaerolineae bacterium]